MSTQLDRSVIVFNEFLDFLSLELPGRHFNRKLHLGYSPEQVEEFRSSRLTGGSDASPLFVKYYPPECSPDTREPSLYVRTADEQIEKTVSSILQTMNLNPRRSASQLNKIITALLPTDTAEAYHGSSDPGLEEI